jgi:plastocyanin
LFGDNEKKEAAEVKNRFDQKLCVGLILSLISVSTLGSMIIGGCSNAGSSTTKTSSIPTTQPLTTSSVLSMTSNTQVITSSVTTNSNLPATSVSNPTNTSNNEPTTSIPSVTTPQIVVKEFSFIPQNITVPVGTTITWINNGSEDHTVSSDTGLFSGSVSPGKTFSFTFTTPGVFNYHCGIHPEMIGTVTVTAK